MRALLAVLLLSSVATARADALGDLRQALHALPGGGAVRGRLEYQLWREVTEDKRPVANQAQATLRVEDGPDGLRLSLPPALFRTALEESRRQLQDPDRALPLRTTLRAVEPDEVHEMLDFGPTLLLFVDYMQVTADQADSYQGQPARMLTVKIAPRLPSNIQKYLKAVDVDARLWLAADGTPVGFRNNITFRGSRMLVSFDGMFKDERTLRRVGGRLVVTRHAHEESFATLGQRNQSRRLAVLTLAE
jgi:hypothetical protein